MFVVFLGVAGYYTVFLKNFASIASALTQLLKKDVPFLETMFNKTVSLL